MNLSTTPGQITGTYITNQEVGAGSERGLDTSTAHRTATSCQDQEMPM